VYTNWPEAQKQITGFLKPKHKSFPTRIEAEAYLRRESPPTTPTRFSGAIYASFPASEPAVSELVRGPFIVDSPTEPAKPELVVGLVTADDITEPPPAKRAKRSQQAASHIAAEEASGIPLGYGGLPPADEEGRNQDGFDYSIKLDLVDGTLKRKTAAELDATKIVKATNSKLPPKFKTGQNEEWVKVWTDGACRANGKRNAAAGVGVWFGPDDPR
jgi:ribonuclease HI